MFGLLDLVDMGDNISIWPDDDGHYLLNLLLDFPYISGQRPPEMARPGCVLNFDMSVQDDNLVHDMYIEWLLSEATLCLTYSRDPSAEYRLRRYPNKIVHRHGVLGMLNFFCKLSVGRKEGAAAKKTNISGY